MWQARSIGFWRLKWSNEVFNSLAIYQVSRHQQSIPYRTKRVMLEIIFSTGSMIAWVVCVHLFLFTVQGAYLCISLGVTHTPGSTPVSRSHTHLVVHRAAGDIAMDPRAQSVGRRSRRFLTSESVTRG